MSTTDIISSISAIIAFFTACFTYKISKSARDISKKQQEIMGNQFNFDIITSCTTRFQEILELIDSYDEKQKIRGYKKYIDLCNEEIFYFQQRYIPEEVMKEWLDGMILFIQHYDKSGKEGFYSTIHQEFISKNNLLGNYPRIKQIFTANKIYNILSKGEQEKILEELFNNIKISQKPKK